MAPVSSDALFDALQHCNLLPQEQFGEVLALIEARSGDVNEAAKTLLERGWFTSFQMGNILAGRCRELVFGPYILVDRISKSRRSEVYKARHAGSDCAVALKVIRAEQMGTAAAASQFMVRMSTLAELEHPNVVQVWDADRVGEDYYCAMEIVDGASLEKITEAEGRLSTSAASQFIRKVALGLQCAHEHNLVHRAIHPGNLFVANTSAQNHSATKILDWSLAMVRPTSAEAAPPITNSIFHQIVGGADYSSPEQVINPEDVDIRSDVYSLGCTFYFLLAGQPPFHGAGMMQKALKHMSAEPEPVEKVNPEVPAGLASILRRMMAKQPKERFQTPAAVALALRPFCQGDGLSADKSALVTQQSPDAERLSKLDDTPLPTTLRRLARR
jgi:eukaryotic-like serine/threonine-protein kinase